MTSVGGRPARRWGRLLALLPEACTAAPPSEPTEPTEPSEPTEPTEPTAEPLASAKGPAPAPCTALVRTPCVALATVASPASSCSRRSPISGDTASRPCCPNTCATVTQWAKAGAHGKTAQAILEPGSNEPRCQQHFCGALGNTSWAFSNCTSQSTYGQRTPTHQQRPLSCTACYCRCATRQWTAEEGPLPLAAGPAPQSHVDSRKSGRVVPPAQGLLLDLHAGGGAEENINEGPAPESTQLPSRTLRASGLAPTPALRRRVLHRSPLATHASPICTCLEHSSFPSRCHGQSCAYAR